MAPNLDMVVRDISDIKRGMAEHNKDDRETFAKFDAKFDGIDSKLDAMIEKLDKKYANKWVETAVTTGLYTVAGILIAAFMSLVVMRV